MPNLKMSVQQRNALTDQYIYELESHSTPENEHKLAVYRYIARDTFSTHEQRFAVLSCQRLHLVRKCPAGHYREVIRRMFCRRRFYCVPCAGYRMKLQYDRWKEAIQTALKLRSLYLGPVLRLSWEIPDVEHKKNIDRFREYLKKTWPTKLSAQGIDPGCWMLLTVYDPILVLLR